jgi:hypothetical protein
MEKTSKRVVQSVWDPTHLLLPVNSVLFKFKLFVGQSSFPQIEGSCCISPDLHEMDSMRRPSASWMSVRLPDLRDSSAFYTTFLYSF